MHFQFALTELLCYMLSVLCVFEIYIEKKVLGQRFWFLHGFYNVVLNASYEIKSCLLLNDLKLLN